MAISYLTMAEKTDGTTRCIASEYNEIKDALTDGTKAIYSQGLRIASTAYATSGAINIGGFAALNSSSGTLAMTLAAPSIGELQIISLVTAGNNATVTAGTGITFDGTNNRATFSTASQTLILFAISATRWVIVENIGTVTFSAV